jgi:hypothetical protein
MEIGTLGIDLAKRVFQLHGVDAKGNVVLNIGLSRTFDSSIKLGI